MVRVRARVWDVTSVMIGQFSCVNQERRRMLHLYLHNRSLGISCYK